MKISSRIITNIGLLIALSIILTRIASIRIAIGGIEGVRIGFGGLPIILGGIMFGPLAGGIVGGVSDILGYIVNPIGAYMPHFTLSSALTGIIPVLFLHISRKDSLNILNLILAIAIGQIITTAIMVPYFLHILFSIPWKVLIIPRLVSVPINILIYSLLIRIILTRYQKIFPQPRD
ncbi:MAG: folate family ECF transporter S component [Arcobacteraceae bacterium]